MRFDDPQHIETFQRRGAFPRIHDAIAGFVIGFSRGTRFLDLCCCYGLLGERLHRAGFVVIGVDANPKVIERGQAAGIEIPLFPLRVGRDTLGELMDLIDEHDISGIVARRALPELFDRDPALGGEFFERARGIGVKEVFLEGRAPTRNAVSALATLEAEIHLAQPWFALDRRQGQCARLVAGDLPQ